MTEQICDFCGDGPESIGTMYHIECVERLMERIAELEGTASIMRANAVDREGRIAELEAENAELDALVNANTDHMTEVGVDACRERDEHILKSDWMREYEHGLFCCVGIILGQLRDDEEQRAEKAEARCKELAEEAADRIGALVQAEAELAALKASKPKPLPPLKTLREMELEAELAALKARRCETCRYWTRYTGNRGECEVSVKVDNINPACTFGCVGWAARAEEGSGDE
jgi:hypothetical protein